MFYDSDRLVACFPAHLAGTTLSSHYGLTYAGFLASAKAEQLPQALESLINYCKGQNIDTLEVKLPPKFYDPNFATTRSNLEKFEFQITDHSTDLYIDFQKAWQPSPKKTAGYRNGKFSKLQLVEGSDFSSFWSNILIPQLQARHDATPVHRVEEIEKLHRTFPQHIRQYDVITNGNKIAGMTAFDFDTVLKVQYAFGTDIGFKLKAMDFLYLEIIQLARDLGKKYVDLGTVNNRDGSINEGLQRFKQELGAVTTPVYTMRLHLQP